MQQASEGRLACDALRTRSDEALPPATLRARPRRRVLPRPEGPARRDRPDALRSRPRRRARRSRARPARAGLRRQGALRRRRRARARGAPRPRANALRPRHARHRVGAAGVRLRDDLPDVRRRRAAHAGAPAPRQGQQGPLARQLRPGDARRVERVHRAVAHRVSLPHVGGRRRVLGGVPNQLDALLNPDYTDEEIRREVRNFGVDKAGRHARARREGHRLQRDGAHLRGARHRGVGRARAARLRARPSARALQRRHAGGDPHDDARRTSAVPRRALPAREHGHGRRVPVVGAAGDGARRRSARRSTRWRPRATRAATSWSPTLPAAARRRGGRPSRRRLPVRDCGPARARHARLAGDAQARHRRVARCSPCSSARSPAARGRRCTRRSSIARRARWTSARPACGHTRPTTRATRCSSARRA